MWPGHTFDFALQEWSGQRFPPFEMRLKSEDKT